MLLFVGVFIISINCEEDVSKPKSIKTSSSSDADQTRVKKVR